MESVVVNQGVKPKNFTVSGFAPSLVAPDFVPHDVASARRAIVSATQYQSEGKKDEALGLYLRACAFIPDDPKIMLNLGALLSSMARPKAASVLLTRGLELQPADAALLTNRGVAALAANQVDRAIKSHQAALDCEPDQAVKFYNLAIAQREKAQFDNAIKNFSTAIDMGHQVGQARWERALSYLPSGDYKNGLSEYDIRITQYASHFRHLDTPLWKGEKLEGRCLMVYREQGFGDTMQFVRYLPLFKELDGRVLFETLPPLKRLLSHSEVTDGIELVIEKQHEEKFDLVLPIISAAPIFKTTATEIPGAVPPYLTPPPNPPRLPRGPGVLNVGIAWCGNPKLKFDQRRSMKINQLGRIFEIPGINFYSLQKGPGEKELVESGYAPAVWPLGPMLSDFASTAQMIEQLDLVISVDSSPLHLAGCLNKPGWLMAHHSPEWRWLWGKETTPWYPSVRIFRQQRFGDWEPVLEAVHSNLVAMRDEFLARRRSNGEGYDSPWLQQGTVGSSTTTADGGRETK